MVKNVHERLIHAPLESVGGLIDRLASRDDAMWPHDRWPPMRFDRPLGVGAQGGHGPIRYIVETYEPGRSVRFRFTAPRGFVGTHGLDVEEVAPGVVRLRHDLTMRVEGVARASWPLAFRWMHDALVEDALDRAGNFCQPEATRQTRWSLYVRLLRRLAEATTRGKRGARSAHQEGTRRDRRV